MTYRTPLITATLLVCAIMPAVPAFTSSDSPKVTDLGVVEFSDKTADSRDLDGAVCVISRLFY